MDLPFRRLIRYDLLHLMIGKEVYVGTYDIDRKMFIRCKKTIINDITTCMVSQGSNGFGCIISWQSTGAIRDRNTFWDTKFNPGKGHGLTGILYADDVEEITSNKGQKNCFKCRCKTVMRRDFSNMSVREFCPRCKV